MQVPCSCGCGVVLVRAPSHVKRHPVASRECLARLRRSGAVKCGRNSTRGKRRWCSECLRYHPVTEFFEKGKGRLQCYCREAARDMKRMWRAGKKLVDNPSLTV